jgi:hypothetical protein
MNRTSNARKQNSAAISHPSRLTACQMALAVISGLSRTCAVSGLVTHYINAHDHRILRKKAPMLRVGATRTKQQQTISLIKVNSKKCLWLFLKFISYFRGGHRNYSPRAPKPLLRHWWQVSRQERTACGHSASYLCTTNISTMTSSILEFQFRLRSDSWQQPLQKYWRYFEQTARGRNVQHHGRLCNDGSRRALLINILCLGGSCDKYSGEERYIQGFGG